jgi:hypothetical protein
MITFIKVLPYVLMLSGVGYFAHWYTVNQLNNQLSQLQSDVKQYQVQTAALQAAAEINQQTIRRLEDSNRIQLQQVNNLTVANQQLQTEKDEYLSIFRRHDLQRLALARPGLIEPRINNGTREVFRDLEQATQQVSNLDE